MSAMASRAGVAFAAAMACAALCMSPAYRQYDPDYDWVGGYGSWFSPDHWYHQEWDPNAEECVDDDTIPGPGDVAHVWSEDPYISAPAATCDWLDLHAGLDLLPGGSLYVVNLNVISGGSVTQTGGTNTIAVSLGLGPEAGATGPYDLRDGRLSTSGPDHIGFCGHGTFTQSGGTYEAGHICLATFTPTSSGEFTLSGGTLSAGAVTLGCEGQGIFTQTGGTSTIDEYLVLAGASGASGYYLLTGASELFTHGELIGLAGTGTFVQTGGTNRIEQGCFAVARDPSSLGTYELHGGELLASGETVGASGIGTFTQTGGTNAISGSLELGNQADSTGYYNLQDGGVSTAGADHIGSYGHGVFTQSGGTYDAGEIIMARFTPTSRGEFNLSAGALSCSGLTVGHQGEGTFTHTGGVNTVGEDPPGYEPIQATFPKFFQFRKLQKA